MNPVPGAPLRVLVLATTFPAVAGDGTPEFVLTLSGALARSGAEVTAVVPRVPGAARSEVVDGVRVRRFAYFPRRWEDLAHGAIMPNLRAKPRRWLQVAPLVLAFQLAAIRAVRRERPDVVHAHWILPAGIVAMLLRRATKLPYVITVHGADAYTLRSGPALRVKRAVVRRAAATVPVSTAIGNEVAKLGPVSTAVPMGVDVESIRAAVGGRRPEPGRVLFVGRLVEKKGVNVLLSAAADVPAARIVIVGDGPIGPELRAQAASLGIAERVEFVGARTRAEVMAELARAAVVALPSQVGAGGDQDGVPVVLGEAMAAGVPVVASDIGGLAEYVSDGDTGRLVPPGSVPELAAALGELIADPDAAEKLAVAASDRMAGSLDLAYVEKRYSRVLAEAAAS